MNKTKGKLFLSSFLWKFFERSGVQFFQIIIQIILARILFPDDYGNVAIITSLIAIVNVFLQYGFPQALIQSNNATDKDFNNVFYFNLLLSIIIYFGIFLISDNLAHYFNNYILSPLIKVYGLVIIFGSITTVQTAYLQKKLLFKKTFFRSIIWIIVQGFSGILLAVLNFGVWSLVISQLLATISGSVLLWFASPWKPGFYFSFKELKKLFGFGFGILIFGLIDSLTKNFQTFFIGRSFDQATLGYYSKGQNIPSITLNLINVPVITVLFPFLSLDNLDLNKLLNTLRKVLQISSFLIFPLLLSITVFSENIILLLFGSKWIPMSGIMQLTSIFFVFLSLQNIFLQAFKALGKIKLLYKIEILKLFSTIIFFFFGISYGINGILFFSIINNFLITMLFSFFSAEIIKYKFVDQLYDTFLPLLLSCITGVIIYFFVTSNYLDFIFRFILFFLIYFTLSILLNNNVIKYLLSFKKFINTN